MKGIKDMLIRAPADTRQVDYGTQLEIIEPSVSRTRRSGEDAEAAYHDECVSAGDSVASSEFMTRPKCYCGVTRQCRPLSDLQLSIMVS